MRLAAALWKLWDSHSHVSEGRRWLEAALARGGAASAARAKALNGLGWMATVQGDRQAIALLEESLALFRELKDQTGIATSLGNLGVAVVYLQSDQWRLGALREEAEALRQEPVGRWATARLLSFLAMAAMNEGDYERAAALAEENLTLNRELGDMQGTNEALIVLGMIGSIRGDYERAATAFEEALHLLRRLGDTESIIHCLLGLAWLAAPRGEPVRAARLWGATEALQEATGSVADSPFIRSQYDYESLPAAARSRLDEAAWEAAWAEGRAMSPEQAAEYALGKAPPSAPATGSYPTGLSAREVEVLRLVAKGFTNPQVAKELFISLRTVHRHLNSIYAKIGESSREAATRFASDHGLL